MSTYFVPSDDVCPDRLLSTFLFTKYFFTLTRVISWMAWECSTTIHYHCINPRITAYSKLTFLKNRRGSSYTACTLCNVSDSLMFGLLISCLYFIPSLHLSCQSVFLQLRSSFPDILVLTFGPDFALILTIVHSTNWHPVGPSARDWFIIKPPVPNFGLKKVLYCGMLWFLCLICTRLLICNK